MMDETQVVSHLLIEWKILLSGYFSFFFLFSGPVTVDLCQDSTFHSSDVSELPAKQYMLRIRNG